MDFVDPYGWHNLDPQKVDVIRSKLSNFESMTWAEILIKGKKQHHTVTVDQLCHEAQQRLESISCGDIDQLVSLHLNGVQRVWGILSEGVLNLLWWDPLHLVCPSLLKHT
jgi:hypothetical protein